MRIGESFRQFRQLIIQFQYFLHFAGNAIQFPYNVQVLCLVYRTFLPGESQCQHGQHSHLSGKCFGRCHSDFRSDVDVRPRMRSAGDGGTNRITDTIYKCTPTFCQFHCCQRIRRFSTLRNGNHHIVLIDHRITVTKFGGILHFYRNTAETFNQMLSDQSRMPRSTASHNNKAFGVQQLFFIVYYCRKHHIIGFHIDTSAHTIVNTVRLLKNLLQHEMRITAFFQLTKLQFYFFHFGSHLHIAEIDYLQFFSPIDHRYLTIFEIHHLICIFYNRCGIRSKEKLIFTNTYHQRTAFSSRNDFFRMFFIKNRNRISTNHFIQSQLNGSKQIDLIGNFHIFD